MDTRSSFRHAVDELQDVLLKMGSDVQQLIKQAVESLAELDLQKAENVVAYDDRIDEQMQLIEQRCLNLIALQQPMAGDLRMIGMALKIAVDLERIADHSVDIAKVTIRLHGRPLAKPLIDIPRMAEIAESMLEKSLRAFIDRDVQLAASLSVQEDEVDHLYSNVFIEITSLMGNELATNKQLVHLLMVAHSLERVADHATNIGEGVIYLVAGKRKDLNI